MASGFYLSILGGPPAPPGGSSSSAASAQHKESNVHPKIVQERLGHSTIVLTMDTYSHVIPGMQDIAADELDKMFTHP
jgi:integrase